MMPRQHIGYPVAHRDTGAKGSEGSVSCQDGGVLPITGFPHVGGKAKEGQHAPNNSDTEQTREFHTTYAFGPRVIVSAVIPSKGALSEWIKFVEGSRRSRDGDSGSSRSCSFGEGKKTMAAAGIADIGRGRLQTAGDAAVKAKRRWLPKLDSAWREELEDASGAVVLAMVEDDEKDGALGAGQEVELRGHERRGAKDSGSWREREREDRRGSGVACRGRSSSGSGGRWQAQ
ncbi:hypothetical protein CFC21_098008 [Triticum aestivum]|uniref:Uncharacterized protein n=2 Tax=Triticum aestivum TaxID=4565 RepID=A0A3B6RJT5_WHEAT|nr:hypothetical protein CFC21_098008 [Triticum aestivum]